MPLLRLIFAVPAALVLAAGAIWLHWHAEPERKKTIEFAVALLGAGVAVYTLQAGVDDHRKTAANRFIERWNDQKFDQYREDWRNMLKDGPVPVDAKPENLKSVRVALNFFEEIAISANRKEADEEHLKAFFYSAVLQFFDATECWVKGRRQKTGQETLYENYEKLVVRWRGKRRR